LLPLAQTVRFLVLAAFLLALKLGSFLQLEVSHNEREVEEETIPQTQTQTPKDESSL